MIYTLIYKSSGKTLVTFVVEVYRLMGLADFFHVAAY